MTIYSALLIISSLVIGNFLYQALFDKSWSTALERSYFQALAIAVCFLLRK